MASRLQGRTHAAQVHPALDLAVFRQMADMSNDAFYLCDERGRFLYLNERAARSPRRLQVVEERSR